MRSGCRESWAQAQVGSPHPCAPVARAAPNPLLPCCAPPQIPAERNGSEEALALQVDALVRAHLLQVSQQMLGLQAALASAGG